MTERFNAPSQQTGYGTSDIGPFETPSSLTALGVGEGSGQTATKQENNSAINFEFPIKWDDLAGNLGKLNAPKSLEQMIDDMTVRDRDLEDFLNTNVVNGIVAGTNITIDRASGVVTITATYPTPTYNWTAFTPQISTNATGGTYATISNNNSAWARIGNVVHVRIDCTATWGSAVHPITVQNLPANIKTTSASVPQGCALGIGIANGDVGYMRRTEAGSPGAATAFFKVGGATANNVWYLGYTFTYEAV